MTIDDWIIVTNRLLENGSELMLIDSCMYKQKKQTHLNYTLKLGALVLYYGVKLLL